VGPTAGSREWFALNRSSADDVAARPCLFDDAFVIGADGSFANQMGDTTWVEGWQNADAGEGACLTPVAPHDGSIAASSVYDEAAGTLTLNGKGAHLGLAKVVNGSELASPSDAPESVTYTVLTFDGDFLSVVVVAGDGVYWSYDLVKDADTTDAPDASSSVLEGKWVLDAAGVGPSSGSREWFALNRSTDADVAARPCLFDDAFVIGADGSFANQMGDATWVEAWQGAAADGCATPVAPHDGSIAASSVYDEAAGTLTLNGKGAHLGLAKVVNGSELASPSDAPESVTYTVLIIESDFLSVEVVAGDGVYWSYDFVKQ
ncbi:glycoside hydrolase family 16 protein, partial [Porticoccaceae bacterium]|nr:glycoside hydrolase family 16 protein [Porticoccaceae bacterium]